MSEDFKIILEENECMLADGFDECIVGITDTCLSGECVRVAVYDSNAIVEKLMKDNDLDFETAKEWFDFNILSQSHTESTPHHPIFITLK
tara:strand:+ start:292 stop:561 length:270 start_codon:yes stop_codon:yes gene_type:complete